MNSTPSHTESHSIFEASNRSRPAPTRHQYRRRDFDSPYFSEDLAPNPQALHRNSDLASQANPSPSERDRENLGPKKQDDEILDSEREYGDSELSRKEDQEYINPNRQIHEENNDLNDEDGAFIDEPSIDDDKLVVKEGQYYLTNEEGDIIKQPSRVSESSMIPAFAKL